MPRKKELLSIVVPCHNEEESAPLFYEKTVAVLKTLKVDYQFLFVDDGSRVKNLEKTREEAYNFRVPKRADCNGEYNILSFLSDRLHNALNRLSDDEIIAGSMDFGQLNRRTSGVILSVNEYSCCSYNYFIFSNQSLNIVQRLGSIITLLAFIYLEFVIVKCCLYGDSVQGWATMICVMLFLGCDQCFGKTYLEVKKRPVYILGESSKDEEIE